MPLFYPASPPPAIISDESASMVGSTAGTLVANTVYLWAFEVAAQTTILGGKWHCGTTAAGTSNMGIYTLAGALVSGSDSGAVSNSVSADVSFTYGTAVSLAAGTYFMAFAPSSSTDTFLSRAQAAGTACSRSRKATNAMAASALPATTGAFVATTATYPACSLTVSGGL